MSSLIVTNQAISTQWKSRLARAVIELSRRWSVAESSCALGHITPIMEILMEEKMKHAVNAGLMCGLRVSV